MDFRGKKVLLLGFGSEGRAALRYLTDRGVHSISIADRSAELTLSSDESRLITHSHLGDTWLEALDGYDVIMRSPGVPRRLLAPYLERSPNCLVTSGTNLFLAQHAQKTIAVTGTKGKSTTSSLLYSVLVASGIRAKFGGNIGVAALSLIDTPADLFVLELSSYQLEDCLTSPHGALFINLYPEHLDHHGDFEQYGVAKARISNFQSSNDFSVIPHNSERIRALTASCPAEKLFFGSAEGHAWIEDEHYHYRDTRGRIRTLFHTSATRLKGPGNHQNILAVLCVAARYEIPEDIITKTITEFMPLPHRLEEVGTINGITFINDSISTVPEATINALETFGGAVKTIILGGFDRGIGFESLATHLVTKSRVQTILLFQPSGARIEAAVREASKSKDTCPAMISVTSMSEAVELARHHTPPDAICLLSPASPSFPLFKNFEERGEHFKREIRNGSA